MWTSGRSVGRNEKTAVHKGDFVEKDQKIPHNDDYFACVAAVLEEWEELVGGILNVEIERRGREVELGAFEGIGVGEEYMDDGV